MKLAWYVIRENKGPPGAACTNMRNCIKYFVKPWCFDDLLCPANKKTIRRCV